MDVIVAAHSLKQKRPNTELVYGGLLPSLVRHVLKLSMLIKRKKAKTSRTMKKMLLLAQIFDTKVPDQDQDCSTASQLILKNSGIR